MKLLPLILSLLLLLFGGGRRAGVTGVHADGSGNCAAGIHSDGCGSRAAGVHADGSGNCAVGIHADGCSSYDVGILADACVRHELGTGEGTCDTPKEALLRQRPPLKPPRGLRGRELCLSTARGYTFFGGEGGHPVSVRSSYSGRHGSSQMRSSSRLLKAGKLISAGKEHPFLSMSFVLLSGTDTPGRFIHSICCLRL